MKASNRYMPPAYPWQHNAGAPAYATLSRNKNRSWPLAGPETTMPQMPYHLATKNVFSDTKPLASSYGNATKCQYNAIEMPVFTGIRMSLSPAVDLHPSTPQPRIPDRGLRLAHPHPHPIDPNPPQHGIRNILRHPFQQVARRPPPSRASPRGRPPRS